MSVDACLLFCLSKFVEFFLCFFVSLFVCLFVCVGDEQIAKDVKKGMACAPLTWVSNCRRRVP